jgi:hypothetical protein
VDRFERALEVAAAALKDEFGEGLVGLLLAGSVAYGTPMANSDVDLYVLIRSDWRQRRNRVIESVEVEMFLNPVPQILRELADGPGATVDMFARGRIVHDPLGVVAQLVERARQAAAFPRHAPGEAAPFLIRYRVSDLLRDVEDLVEIDPTAAELLLGLALHATLEAYWSIRGEPPPKPKVILEALRAEAPSLADEGGTVLATGRDLADRARVMRELCERVLEPVGGLLLEGQTPREHLPDLD